MPTYTTTEIANILGSSILGVTPTPTPGYSLALIDDIARGLTAGMLSFMSATKGISSLVKSGETITITYTDGTTQTFTVADGEPGTPGTDGADAGWTVTSESGTSTVSLSNGQWVYVSSPSSYITVSSNLSSGESSILEIVTGSSAVTFSVPSNTKHFGDSVADGVLSLSANSHYLITYLQGYNSLYGFSLKRS